jgi:hypothetical protein
MGNGLTYSRYVSEYSRHIDLVVRYMEYSRNLNMSEHPTSTDSRCSFAVSSSELLRFVSAPGQLHMAAAKHLVRCIQGSRELGIMYSKRSIRVRIRRIWNPDFQYMPGICHVYPMHMPSSPIYMEYTWYILVYTMDIQRSECTWYIHGYTTYIDQVYTWYIHGYTWYIF